LRYRHLFRTSGKSVRRRRVFACALAVLGVAWWPTAVHADTSPAASTACQDLQLPVTMAGLPESMYGRLCVPAGGAKTVQLLVPGASYNHTYWDFPYTPDIRSYRLAMNEAGYATLTVDRLGTGQSSRPPSILVTSASQAVVIHQVVQMLRAGTAPLPRFDKIILGGHSVGSAIAIIEAGTYHDVDGVLVTGLTHGVNALGAVPILSSLVPAALDPKFIGKVVDLGYLTTAVGTRWSSFDSPGPMDENVAALEESTKDDFAVGEVVDTVLIGVVTTYSRLIDVPVMLAMGGGDPAFCGLLAANCSTAATLRTSEAPYYSAQAQLQTYVVSGYGHALNYAPNAPDYHAAVVKWANALIGH
jgi:pimeloyl-ACP methyl ester carboxylesterase